jgi:membrane-associated phospholipid phosphatase
MPDAPRGALVFALVALVLVWARVRDERHKPVEVLAGFVLAALVAGVSIHSF